MAANYNSINGSQQGVNHPYGAGNPYYAESTGFITPQQTPKKRGMSNWIKIGVPVLVVVIVAAVVGGVVGSRHSNKTASSSGGGSSGSANSDNNSPHSAGASFNLDDARFATATNSKYLQPLYPSTVRFRLFILFAAHILSIKLFTRLPILDCCRLFHSYLPSL